MVILINPRYEISFQPPLGIGYVAAYLKSQGIKDVQIIDTTFEDLDKKMSNLTGSPESVKNPAPIIIGIYIMTLYLKKAAGTITILKNRFPHTFIVAGGPHPTIAPEELLRKLPVSVCMRGEGEITFSRLVKAVIEQKDFSTLKGISYKDPGTGTIHHNPDADPIPDISTLPFPARELLPMDFYLKGGTQKTFSYKKIRATTMITSRGCPYNCSYCQPTLRSIFGKQVRFRSVENVMEEIEYLIKTYGIQGLFLLDDTFTCNKKFVFRFCEEIQKRKIRLAIAINSRVDTISEDILDHLKKAGIVTITYGIESGNQDVLDNLKKGITIEHIKQAVLWTKNRGIHVYGYFIVGSSMESRKSLKQTFSPVKSLPFDEVQFSMAAPYKWIHPYNQAATLNLCTDTSLLEEKGYFAATVMKSLYLSQTEIKKYHRNFNIYAKLKSIKNLLKHPGAFPSLVINRIIKKIVPKGYIPGDKYEQNHTMRSGE